METNIPLVTLEDMRRVRPIVQNIQRFERFEPFVKKSQLLDIRPILGVRLFTELLTSSTETRFQNLLNGETYTDASGNDVYFVGLKDIICLFSFGRFIEQHGINITETGAVEKNIQEATPVDYRRLDRVSRDATTEAKQYVEDLKMYLYYKRELFPLYNAYTLERDYRPGVGGSSFKLRVGGKKC
jgi:hypothetical protein